MLIRRPILDAIVRGEVTHVFRRWDRPRVVAGSQLRTSVGVIAVGSVEPVGHRSITLEDALRAGFASRAALLRALEAGEQRRARADTTPVKRRTYRVSLRYAGPDPRAALRKNADLSDDDVAALRARLTRWDRASQHGPWTQDVLRLIAARPETPAAELAQSLGRGNDVAAFKRDVRKLKELGLTESLSPGYRLSPRGAALLERL